MSERIQSNSSRVAAVMKQALTVTMTVFLLATFMMWAAEVPDKVLAWAKGSRVQAAELPAENPAPPSPSSVVAAEIVSPPAAPDPAAEPAPPKLTEPTPAEEGVNSDKPDSAEATASPSTLTYIVREGDTLSKIARAHSISVDELIAANSLPDPNLLYAGQTLGLPDGTESIVTAPLVPISEAAAEPTPIPAPALVPEGMEGDRWIDVDLADQRLTAYEGSTLVRTTLVSTGLPGTPTPVGQFRIWIKFRFDDMAGADYYIKDVPFVMYFHEGYGLHGVTWHGNFGHPMSHGCVNLPTLEAEWLFGFAEVGTLVNIH